MRRHLLLAGMWAYGLIVLLAAVITIVRWH
jgi:hypothetical protein